MQKRIFRVITFTIFIVVIVLTSLCYVVFYNEYAAALKNELKALAAVAVSSELSPEEISEVVDANTPEIVRITYIASDGSVIFDSLSKTTENHANRKEFMEALATGVGESERYSQTLKVFSYYYATRYRDGVLRFATEHDDVVMLIFQLLPVLLVIVGGVIIVAVISSMLIAKRLTSPLTSLVSKLDVIDNPVDSEEPIKADCEELEPVVRIISNMRGRLKSYVNQLEEANAVRREFTANVSHELKTPLTTIRGFGEMLEQGLIKEEADVKKYGATIYRESNRLLGVIGDIMKLSEIEESSDIDLSPVILKEPADEAVELLKDKMKRLNVSVCVHGSDTKILANRAYISELFLNLVDNAVKYNVSGGNVDVTIRQSGQKAEIIVEDTGIGIPPQCTERVFERFYRVDKSRSKETGGTGLGLSIVKHIVAYHGGEMTLESEVGKGTRITVLLPNIIDK